MEEKNILKNALIEALQNTNFDVCIEEPNNVSLREKYDGSLFLFVRGDDIKFGVYCGNCEVRILGHTFICEFDYGEWSAGREEDEWLIEEEDFIEALESAEGVICGEQTDLDSQAWVYCRANNLPNDIPAYWEEDDIPKSIGLMDWYDPVPGTVSILLNNGERTDVECDLVCESIYHLYCALKEKDLLYKTPDISSSFIKEEVPDLYQEILDDLQSNSILEEEANLFSFSFSNTKEFFESILG